MRKSFGFHLLRRRKGMTLLCRPQFLSSSWSRSVGTFTTFSDYLTSRRVQASKSLIIQVSNPESAKEVSLYLSSKFGPINAVYHYVVPRKGTSSGSSVSGPPLQRAGDSNHWLLAEFKSSESAAECLKSCGHPEGTIPSNLSMCWYRPQNGKKSSSSCSKGGSADEFTSPPKVLSERLDAPLKEDQFRKKSLNDQLKLLEESTRLTELGIRLRFFVASQLEQSFKTFFPLGCVLPFGSTVSGIGRKSGDLDLVVVPDRREVFPEPLQTKEEETSLYFHSKLSTASNSSNARFQAQRVMETMADVIHLFMPGCNHVQRILQARIPILRFWSEFTNLQCDLSMTNSSGVYMSELIYLMGQIEPRFSTLIFAVRSWASARKITNPIPGRQPTNFMLVLLLIYFLQRRQLLPTLDILFNNAGAQDERITMDGIDCSFLRDKERILKYFTPNLEGNESVAELLFDFFEFYSDFDFNQKGVSLVTGSAWGKPDAGPLYIQNPLERHLNVARNVSKEEVTRFKNECCSALWKLETSWHALNSPQKVKGSGSSEVSLKEVLLSPALDSKIPTVSDQQRLRVKELFTK